MFALNNDGSDFSNLYFFTPTFTSSYTNDDGAGPAGILVLAAETVYGTTVEGGSAGNGTVFAVNVNGTGFTNIHSFVSATDGAGPQAGLLLAGDTLFGTTFRGGGANNGTIFAVRTNGTAFTNLHTFSTLSGSTQTNYDGAGPVCDLVLSGTNLFGAAQIGGRFGAGTLFKLSMDGSGFETLYNFSAVIDHTNNDGAEPHGRLVLSEGTLYGVAGLGGNFGNGSAFAVGLMARASQTCTALLAHLGLATWSQTSMDRFHAAWYYSTIPSMEPHSLEESQAMGWFSESRCQSVHLN